MAPDYQIRRAGPADHAGVARELAAYFAFLGEDVDPDGLDHDVADWQGEYDGRAGVMLVVVDAVGAVVGTAAVRRLEPGVAELKRMWLRPEHRGRGLADRLMERVLSELDNLGDGDRIRLLVPHDPQPLYRILKMNGYTHSSALQDDGTVEVLIWKSPAMPG